MHCSFGRADALLVIAMKAQPLLRDLKMQFTKTATPQPQAAEILCGPMPAPQASAYNASKAAVDAIRISLSRELGSRKIRVNSLDPGMFETHGLRASGMDHGAFCEQMERQLPLAGSLSRKISLWRQHFLPVMTRDGSRDNSLLRRAVSGCER